MILYTAAKTSMEVERQILRELLFYKTESAAVAEAENNADGQNVYEVTINVRQVSK